VLSRCRLAVALASTGDQCNVEPARQDLAAARCEAQEFGMVLPAVAATHLTDRPGSNVGSTRPVFERCGRRWRVELDGRSVVVEHCRGLDYLAILVGNPGQEIPAVELAAGPGTALGALTNQPVLDQQAVHGYRQRLAALADEIERCDAAGDRDGGIRAQAEHDWLIAELGSTIGLAGRVRSFTTADELARVAVGKAIRRALHRVAEADPVLVQALSAAVRTGQRCVYDPSTGRQPV
jgi:uncharacterized small protein (DUF1192 family)